MPVPLLSDMAVLWIESGVAKRLFNAIATESAARMKLARKILPARARSGACAGVVIVASQDFAAEADIEPSVRMSLGAPPDRETLIRGLRVLAALEEGA